MDLRLNSQKTAVNQKIYKTNNQFSSICSTADGRFAVGSKQGVVRLYNQVGTKSINNFYTLQHKNILMIDTTKDGQYLLVTTP